MLAYVTFVTLIIATANAIMQPGHAVSHQMTSYAAAQGNDHMVKYVPVYGGHGSHDYMDYYAPPHYQYEYAVEDKHTGDIKSHHEERDGDTTKGYYTVHEPDGTILTVHYTVEKDSGFQAVVERKGHALHIEPVKKVAVVAPIVHHAAAVIAPIVHHAPAVVAAVHH